MIKYACLIILLAVLIYFRLGIFNFFSYVSTVIFRPVFVIGNNIGNSLDNNFSYFYSKKSLFIENQNLKDQLIEKNNKLSDYNSILDENEKMKEILGRKNEKMNLILAGILSKPNQSLYDTLIIDGGTKHGITNGKKVFALGNVPIGRVAEVYPDYSKVVLYSNPGEKTEVVVSGKDTFMQVLGRGSGNFEMVLPRDFDLEKGTEVTLPGIVPFTLGIVETILSDPRDSFQKALLRSPVNVFDIKFVEVEK